MPESLQLALSDVEESQLYCESFPNDWTPYPIFKGEPPVRGSSCLSLVLFWSLQKACDQRWGWEHRFSTLLSRSALFTTADQHSQSVSVLLHPSLTREQDPEILLLKWTLQSLPAETWRFCATCGPTVSWRHCKGWGAMCIREQAEALAVQSPASETTSWEMGTLSLWWGRS